MSNLAALELDGCRYAAVRHIPAKEFTAGTYYVPTTFDQAIALKYKTMMNTIYSSHARLVSELTKALRLQSSVSKHARSGAWAQKTRSAAAAHADTVLPLASYTAREVYTSRTLLNSTATKLQASSLAEARDIGAQLVGASTDETHGAVSYLAKTAHTTRDLTGKLLRTTHMPATRPVQLVAVWPRNELELVPDIAYQSSNVSLREIQSASTSWSYDEKEALLTAYIGTRTHQQDKPGRALEKAHYSWDIVTDIETFRQFQKLGIVDAPERQDVTPRYGYEVPDIIQQNGLSDLFEDCFDQSLQLHSMLIDEGFADEAQYAVLSGHKMRWKVTFNAREAFHIIESLANSPKTRSLATQLHETLSSKHPLIGRSIRR